MKNLCVVHLVRAHNGTEPFKRFLDSYRNNPGGMEHDLLIVFKGFERQEDAEAYRKLLAPLPHLSLEISDEGFDITAYFKALDHFSEQYKYFCFLNSFSVIQDPEWLKKLHDHIVLPKVGLVGATGSWVSHNPWGRISHLRKIRRWDKGNTTSGQTPGFKKRIIHKILILSRLLVSPVYFGRYPNPHLRTNVFMISSEVFNRIEFAPIKSKMDAYKFESGRKSLTRQILKLGKQVLVVGRDGIGYDMTAWDRSGIFFQMGQENLLVADNLTQQYQCGSQEERNYLSSLAWDNAIIRRENR